MRRAPLLRWALAGTLLLTAAMTGAGQAPPLKLRLLDLDGHAVDPFAQKQARALVFLFVRSDCPVSNRYAPEIQRLHAEFVSQGITFWLVYPDANAGPDAIRAHLHEYHYQLAALRDPRQALVKATGAQVTPEAAVFVRGRQVYRGRIDDRYVELGKERPAPSTHDLEQVLQTLARGETPKPRTTPAVGCFISDLRTSGGP